MYEALTFDCYGTLVDWRGGLLAALRSCPALSGAVWDEGAFLAARLRQEARLESGPWRPYREIVAASVQVALAAQGVELPAGQAASVGAGVAGWQPFADARPALEILGAGRRLAIVSNVDTADLQQTVARLGVKFSHLITAEELRSYKPAPAHLRTALHRLQLAPSRVLHVAQSLYHDVQPAAAMGLPTAWINRLGEPLPVGTRPTLQRPDLASLAATLGPGS